MINYCKQNCINTNAVDCITADGIFTGCTHAESSSGVHCKVISHRGCSHLAPENTLASVAASIEVGADACEFDVRTTADGHVVLMHDATVDRTTNGTGGISEMTLEDAQALDAGSWKGGDYIGQPVPSLDNVFELMHETGQHALVELKDSKAVEGIIETAGKYNMTNRTIALSETREDLIQFKHIQPMITRALLCTEFPHDVKSSTAKTEWLIEQAELVSARIVDIDYRFTSPGMISSLHRAGIEVWVWTVNDPTIMQCLIEWNIDAIASDKPDLLKKSLA